MGLGTRLAEESRGISRWLWSVCGGGGGGGGGIYRWLWRVCASPGVGASPGGFGEWGHLQVALESEGITRGFGEWGHLQVALECGGHLQVALESGGHLQVALECGGHLQVALESGGIYRWLWRVSREKFSSRPSAIFRTF